MALKGTKQVSHSSFGKMPAKGPKGSPHVSMGKMPVGVDNTGGAKLHGSIKGVGAPNAPTPKNHSQRSGKTLEKW